jgi:predicted permease
LFPIVSQKLVLAANRNYANNMLIGLLTAIFMPIVAVIICLLGIGFYLGLLMFAVWFLFLLLGWLLGVVAFGVWLESILNRQTQVIKYSGIILGIVAVSLLRLIPVLGTIVSLVLVFAGSGAIYRSVWHSRQNAV